MHELVPAPRIWIGSSSELLCWEALSPAVPETYTIFAGDATYRAVIGARISTDTLHETKERLQENGVPTDSEISTSSLR